MTGPYCLTSACDRLKVALGTEPGVGPEEPRAEWSVVPASVSGSAAEMEAR